MLTTNAEVLPTSAEVLRTTAEVLRIDSALLRIDGSNAKSATRRLARILRSEVSREPSRASSFPSEDATLVATVQRPRRP